MPPSAPHRIRRCDARHPFAGVRSALWRGRRARLWIIVLLRAAGLPIAFAMRGISINASGSKLIQPAPLISPEQIKKLGIAGR